MPKVFTLGVDVSDWEGNIDWSLAAQWLPFVYYKCTEGTSFVDSSFSVNKKGCMDFGVPHSAYHYYHPDLDPILQAKHFAEVAGDGYKVLIVDVEREPSNYDTFQPDLKKFIFKAQSLSGCSIAIYTSAGKWNDFTKLSYPSWVSGISLIVAHYTTNPSPLLPHGFENWDIWQFSKYFCFPGCQEYADGNWYNGPLFQARQYLGNYRAVDPPVYNNTRVRSQFDQLHIRQLPSKVSKELGHLSKGEIVEVLDLGGDDVWIRHERGWSCVEQKDYRFMSVVANPEANSRGVEVVK